MTNQIDNINMFFGDISVKLESATIGTTKMGNAGMTSGLHRANASQFFFKKNYTELTLSERNALFGMAMATVSAKQATRMVMVALPIMSKLDASCIPIMKKMAEAMPRSNATTSPDSITPVRMAAAFPDIAIVGACLNHQAQVTQIFSRWENRDIFFPSALAFAQAYQLDLNPELKNLAAHFNVTYWMDTVKSKLEVDSGPKFNFTYMNTGMGDKYLPYVMSSKMDKALQEYFSSTFDLEKLMKYHITVNMAFRESARVTLARVQEMYDELAESGDYQALVAEISDLSKVNADMLPSGEKKLVSNTDEFISSRNRSVLQGAASTTTIIQAAPAPSSDPSMLKILDEISKRMVEAPKTTSSYIVEKKKLELKAKYPRLDDQSLTEMAQEEIMNMQQKSIISRFMGW